MATQARFSIGQVVHHLKFDYRGVVVDVDAEFQGSDEWYDQVALSRPPKNKPWYHVLVDNATHMTYVAERHLESDTDDRPISHPALNQYFDERHDGIYRMRRDIN
jgi:heat shock protein HspQ